MTLLRPQDFDSAEVHFNVAAAAVELEGQFAIASAVLAADVDCSGTVDVDDDPTAVEGNNQLVPLTGLEVVGNLIGVERNDPGAPAGFLKTAGAARRSDVDLIADGARRAAVPSVRWSERTARCSP